MKLNQLFNRFVIALLFAAVLMSCGSDDDKQYIPVSPVNLDLAAVPYKTLSEYKFFDGEMKNLQPAYKVLPYDLNSPLFTDYAHKKRFIWMPVGVKATYNGDGKVLVFPAGTVLIKSFYYDNVQPANATRIIETRLMIKKDTGWIFATYVWNDDQTEATLNMKGSYTDISWQQNGTAMNANYRIPSEIECFTCHKSGTTAIPVGTKPQNLNKTYTYPEGSLDQLAHWKAVGYLDEAVPNQITSTVNWEDASQPIALRVRSYLDINCAHCHSEGAHCSYRVMRFAFSETTTDRNLGICIAPQEAINPSLTNIVTKKNAQRSALHYRLNSNEPSERMPLLGRSIKHTEAIEMIKQWINGMNAPCP